MGTNAGQKIDWKRLVKCIKNPEVTDGKIEGMLVPLIKIKAKGERVSNNLASLLEVLKEKRPGLHNSFLKKKGNCCKK